MAERERGGGGGGSDCVSQNENSCEATPAPFLSNCRIVRLRAIVGKLVECTSSTTTKAQGVSQL